MSEHVTRREFLSTSGKAAVGLAAGAAVMQSCMREARSVEPNNRLNIALIGCGGMGNANLDAFMRTGSCNVLALCDVDRSRLDDTAKKVEKQTNRKPATFANYKELLDQKDIEAVIIGTPDHWHAIPMIAACAAGKDVYVEKPCCHNIKEGRAMVEAAKKFDRVVQVGTHQRSGAHFQQARDFIRAGKLGVISMTESYTWGNEAPDGMGDAPDGPVPDGVDYDAWLGPAPVRPFNHRRFHNSFRWYFDYAAGMVGDWNVHLQDIIMWALETPHCDAVSTSGGKLVLTDDRDTPDTMLATYEFGPGKYTPKGHAHIYVMRKASGPPWSHGGYGMVFHGTNGKLHLNRAGWEVVGDFKDWGDPAKGRRVDMFESEGFDNGDAHLAHVKNFIECVQTRNKPVAWIEDHFKTVTCCHLANVSIRCQSKLYWNPAKEMCYADKGHSTPHEAANKLLGRDYRKGYELPQV